MQDHEIMNDLFDRLRKAYFAWAENFWEPSGCWSGPEHA
jgi:hypothetical protein